MERQYDLVIIGAGPAGMTAGIYAARAGLQTLILDNGAPGGKMIKTHMISNYPGVQDVPGTDLAMKMMEQCMSFGVSVEYGEVVRVTADKQVELLDGSVIQAQAVLVACGTKERLLNIPGEQELIGRGISFCAVCDGAFFRDKDVVVIGGGNSALEESLFLTQFVKSLTIVIRRDVFRGEKLLQDKIEANEKIRIITKHIPKEVLSENGKVSGIVLENVDTKEQQTVVCQGLFPYVGQDPNTDCLKGLNNVLDSRGYMLVDDNMQTIIPGIYGAGDIIQKELRQVVTACNDGAIAAQHAFHQIKGM